MPGLPCRGLALLQPLHLLHSAGPRRAPVARDNAPDRARASCAGCCASPAQAAPRKTADAVTVHPPPTVSDWLTVLLPVRSRRRNEGIRDATLYLCRTLHSSLLLCGFELKALLGRRGARLAVVGRRVAGGPGILLIATLVDLIMTLVTNRDLSSGCAWRAQSRRLTVVADTSASRRL
eukprot:scaffold3749_cov457-Prasinococcus_capsulatus_cf.AAC.6